MSRTSSVTLRDAPVQAVSSVASGGLVIHGEIITVDTSRRVEIIDLTDRVMERVRASGVREGLVSLWSLHTTCALFINESQQALAGDFLQFLEEFAPQNREYRHNDPAQSDCSRANTDSHLRAMLLGHSITLQVSGGEAVLGQWQRVLMAELDGGRSRSFRIQILGVV